MLCPPGCAHGFRATEGQGELQAGRVASRGGDCAVPTVCERVEPVAVCTAESDHQQCWPAGFLPPWCLSWGQMELLPPEGQNRWEFCVYMNRPGGGAFGRCLGATWNPTRGEPALQALWAHRAPSQAEMMQAVRMSEFAEALRRPEDPLYLLTSTSQTHLPGLLGNPDVFFFFSSTDRIVFYSFALKPNSHT